MWLFVRFRNRVQRYMISCTKNWRLYQREEEQSGQNNNYELCLQNCLKSLFVSIQFYSTHKGTMSSDFLIVYLSNKSNSLKVRGCQSHSMIVYCLEHSVTQANT